MLSLRDLISAAALGSALLFAGNASAQATVLIVSADSRQVTGLELAKVMADDASLWLRVRVAGPGPLAVIVAGAAIDEAPAADPFWQVLDESTRVRVRPPLEPSSACARVSSLGVVDTGAVTNDVFQPSGVLAAGSALDLERTLRGAGLTWDSASLARFVQRAAGPYVGASFRAPAAGGVTATLRLRETGHALEVPGFFGAGLSGLPLTLLLLTPSNLDPEDFASADVSELPVSYGASQQSTDYLSVRARWGSENAPRFLCEARVGAGVFGWRASVDAPFAPLATRYFRAYLGAAGEDCAARVRAAHESGSRDAPDFRCEGGDDLERMLRPFAFQEPQLNRFYGTASEEGQRFHTTVAQSSGPVLTATALDLANCAAIEPPTSAWGSPSPTVPYPVTTAEPEREPGTPLYQSDGSCNAVIIGSGSDDSSYDSRTSNDSCSGESSSATEGESCASDPTPGAASEEDQCAGDSESGADASGCSKSEYDGDTCTGDTSADARAQSLRAGPRPKPRPLRLSLLTWLAAALALPLRRILGSR